MQGDQVGDVQAVVAMARAIRAAAGPTPLRFTRRSMREGGEAITVGEAEVVRVHEAVCASGGVDLVDWEMSGDAERLDDDVARIAVMPQGPQDMLTLLAATHAASQRVALPLISLSMGAYGSLSRMVGWVFGSTITFAIGVGGSAPGKLPIDELRAELEVSRKALSRPRPCRCPERRSHGRNGGAGRVGTAIAGPRAVNDGERSAPPRMSLTDGAASPVPARAFAIS